MTEPQPEPMLRGELVYLGAVEPGDVIDYRRLISDPEIGHYLGLKLPVSRDSAERFAKELFEQVGKTVFPFNIHLRTDGRRVGSVTLRDVDRENGKTEVAIFIGERELLGRGYGTDALRCACDFGFGELRLERIELAVFDYNTRGIRAYQKAGFQTDVVKRHARFHRGRHHDVLIMSILRDEWEAQDRRRAWES